ncbi:MAG: histidinol-phosphate transaminase [Capnocytophaga sp.]|nr:histidinol-phosphate transaminase [Capnocytophaga sp.]
MQNLIRENVRNLAPYSSARDEYKGLDGIFLDANENPFGEQNRYPDPYQRKLKAVIAEKWGIPADQLFLGNGSDEVIDLVFRVFCNPKEDKVLTFSPTYGMYEVSAAVNNVEMIHVPLTADFQIDFQSLEKVLEENSVKVIFICSPNNPTGNLLKNIERIFEIFNGIIVIDEAYIDFSQEKSWALQVQQYPQLIVSRTLSKARGLAGVRIGAAVANPEIIAWLNKVKPPYNISSLNQEYALKVLENDDFFEKSVKIILEERQKLISELSRLSFVKKIFPTDANFVLIEVDDAQKTYDFLAEKQIVIRNRNKQIANTLRITIGSPKENEKLIKALQSFV